MVVTCHPTTPVTNKRNFGALMKQMRNDSDLKTTLKVSEAYWIEVSKSFTINVIGVVPEDVKQDLKRGLNSFDLTVESIKNVSPRLFFLTKDTVQRIDAQRASENLVSGDARGDGAGSETADAGDKITVTSPVDQSFDISSTLLLNGGSTTITSVNIKAVKTRTEVVVDVVDGDDGAATETDA